MPENTQPKENSVPVTRSLTPSEKYEAKALEYLEDGHAPAIHREFAQIYALLALTAVIRDGV